MYIDELTNDDLEDALLGGLFTEEELKEEQERCEAVVLQNVTTGRDCSYFNSRIAIIEKELS